MVNAKWRENDNWFRCMVAADHGDTFTCHWLDGDVTYRQIPKTAAQKNSRYCDAGPVEPDGQRRWTDLANPAQALSVLTFIAPEPGWELAELHLSTSVSPSSRMVIRVTPNSTTRVGSSGFTN